MTPSVSELKARVVLSLAVESGDRSLHALLQKAGAAELVADPAAWLFPREAARISLDAARRTLDEASRRSIAPVLPGTSCGRPRVRRAPDLIRWAQQPR